MGKVGLQANSAWAMLVICTLLSGCAKATNDTYIVEFTRSGGIAGLMQELEISGSRSSVLRLGSVKIEFEIAPERYAALIDLLNHATFVSLSAEYLPDSKCCDLFEYTIRYRDHTVRTMTTTIPAELEAAIQAFEEIISEQLAY